MDNDDGLRRLAGGIVQLDEVVERRAGDRAEARAEAERVSSGRAGRSDRTRRHRRGRECHSARRPGWRPADRGGEATHNRGDTFSLHPLDFLRAAFRVGARIANTISSLAPPIDLMPPASLMAFSASSAPRRPYSPSCASAPVTGCRMPILMAGGLRPENGRMATVASEPKAAVFEKRPAIKAGGCRHGTSPFVMGRWQPSRCLVPPSRALGRTDARCRAPRSGIPPVRAG